MNKWLGVAVMALIANGAFALQEQPGAADFKACQQAAEKNDWGSVITSCEKTVAANPDVFHAHYILAWAYFQTKDWANCGGNYETYIEKLGNEEAAQNREVANRQAGICFAQAGELAKAIPYLQKSAAAKPNDVAVQSVLARSLLRSNQEAAAKQAFEKVIQLKPDDTISYYFSGYINYRQKDWANASSRLSKYLELDANGNFAADAHFMSGSSMYYSLDQVADKAAQYPTIKSHMSTFLAAKPTAPQASEAHYVLGWIAAQEEDNETAKTHFEAFLQLQPTGPQAEEAQRFLDELAESAG